MASVRLSLVLLYFSDRSPIGAVRLSAAFSAPSTSDVAPSLECSELRRCRVFLGSDRLACALEMLLRFLCLLSEALDAFVGLICQRSLVARASISHLEQREGRDGTVSYALGSPIQLGEVALRRVVYGVPRWVFVFEILPRAWVGSRFGW